MPSECENEFNWISGGSTIFSGTSCAEIGENVAFCDLFDSNSVYIYEGKTAGEACCICGGSDFQLVAPSEVPSDEPSHAPSISGAPGGVTLAPSGCTDADGWEVVINGLSFGIGCDDIAGTDTNGNDFNNCSSSGSASDANGQTANQACCACGGGTQGG